MNEQHDAVLQLENELFEMMRRRRASMREMSRDVHPKLDVTGFWLLVTLFMGDPRRVSDLAASLMVDKSTLSRQIDAVSRLGLVERQNDPDDARARLVALTPEGREIVKAQTDRRRVHMRDVLNTWDAHEISELTRLLHKAGVAGVL